MDSTESLNSSAVDEDENDNASEFQRESSFREDASSKRITWDGVMKAPPVIIEDESAKLEEAIESTTPKIESAAALAQLVMESKNEALPYNTRALPKDAKTYELEKFQKNALLIFNQVQIDGYKKPREGTEKDVNALEATFRKYGFEVFVCTDYKLNEIRETLRNFSQKNYTEYGCVGVVVLTHGTNNGYLRAKDGKYSENEIINCFKAHDKPTLVSKPKIFIIQACRGAKLSPVVHVGEVSQASKLSKDLAEDLEPYTLPVEADMLVFHSSYAGSPSIRDIEEGSWFIQSLCSKIDELAETDDLASIFTEVKREVAIDREHEERNRRTNEMEVNKQMPVVTTTLIRKLYLKKFGDEISNDLRLSQNLSPRKISRNEEMDLSPPSPRTPQFDMCTCYLNHFNYLRDCLRYHTEENPQDSVAQGLLATANTMLNMEAFNLTKQTLSRTICEHFKTNASAHDYYKYMYLVHKSHLQNS